MTTRGNYCIPVAHVRARSPKEFLEKNAGHRPENTYTRVYEAVVIINRGGGGEASNEIIFAAKFRSSMIKNIVQELLGTHQRRSCIVEERAWRNFDAEVKEKKIFEDRVAVVEGEGMDVEARLRFVY